VFFLENDYPLVSVVIASYNGAKYIKDSIDSAVLQEVPTEIIFINDFSSDNTDEIMSFYTSRYSNIIYLKNEKSLGVAETRNRGVNIANGKYVAFLDVDDVWKKDKLKKQIELMEKKKCVFSFTARELITDEGKITGRIISVPEKITYKKLLKTNHISCSSVVSLKSIVKEFPMKKDSVHEDYMNWLQILKKYDVAYGINEPLLKYRLTPNGKSRSKLKSAVMTYRVHRELNSNVMVSIYYTFFHIVSGIKKYSKSYIER